MTTVIERLRVSKQRAEEAAIASGRECGATWARSAAEYPELQRIWSAVSDGSEIGLDDLQKLIDPADEMNRHDWHSFWQDHGDSEPTDIFAEGFAKGAYDVFNEVKDKL